MKIVKCIQNKDTFYNKYVRGVDTYILKTITLGAYYKVLEEKYDKYLIQGDHGKKVWHKKERFRVVPTYGWYDVETDFLDKECYDINCGHWVYKYLELVNKKKEVNMKNYFMIDGKQIPMSEETTKDLKKQFGLDKPKLWKPERGEIYFIINTLSDVDEAIHTGHNVDYNRFTRGNCYKTREEAEFELARRKLIQEIREFAYDNDMVLKKEDALKIGVNSYIIFYSLVTKKLSYGTKSTILEPNIIPEYFKDSESVYEIIAKFGDRIKKYIFGV